MILAATPLDPPEGEYCWTFHFINDSEAAVESVVVECVDYEWGDVSNQETVDVRVGPIPPGGVVKLLKETDTEVRTSLILRVRTAGREDRILAEFGRLYRKPGPLVSIPILNRPGKKATIEKYD